MLASAAGAQAKKIGMKQAQQIATRRAEGLKLKHKDLVTENGKPFYSIDFKDWDGSIRKVNVDAYTGNVLSVEKINPWDPKPKKPKR
jgi:Predicted membrane protein